MSGYEFCTNWDCTGRWLNDWQTLVGALIAIPAALAAVGVPLYQERARVRRRAMALKATLPLRLSEISSYASEALKRLAECRTTAGVSTSKLAAFQRPAIPVGLSDALERTIEALTSHRANRRLAKMLGQMQVLDANMSDPKAMEVGQNLDSFLMRAAILYAQASSLFDFARDREGWDIEPLKWSEVVSALNIAGVREHAFPGVHGFVQRFYEVGKDPEQDDQPVPAGWLVRLWRRVRYAWFALFGS